MNMVAVFPLVSFIGSKKGSPWGKHGAYENEE
jgi:hypothetical protein